jgi:hypothetical protein
MNPKQIKILLIILGIILVGIFIRSRQVPPEVKLTEETVLLAPELKKAEITSIRIQKKDSADIAITKKDNSWTVPSLWNAPADEKKVTKFMETLSALRGEERANSAEVLPDFGIRDEEAIHLVLFDDSGEKTHLLAGTKNAGWGNLFLRKNGSNKVYIVAVELSALIGVPMNSPEAKLDANQWANRDLFSLDPAQVQKAEIMEGGADWREIGAGLAFETDPAKFQNYVRELLLAKAETLADPQGKNYGLDNPLWQLRLTLKDGSQKTLTVGNSKEESSKDRYAKSSDTGSVFLVSGFTLDRINIDGSRLIRSNPLEIETPEKTVKLSVQTPEKKFELSPKTKTWPGLNSYLEALKSMMISKSGTSLSKPSTAPYRLEIETEGKPAVKLACAALPAGDKDKEEQKESLCVNEANNIPFVLSQYVFQNLFEKPEALIESTEKTPLPGTPEPDENTQDISEESAAQ